MLLENESFYDIDEQNIDAKKKRKKKQLEDAKIFLETFDTPSGELALKKMLELFVAQPIANPNDDLIAIGIREGQARLTRWIIQQMNIAKEGA